MEVFVAQLLNGLVYGVLLFLIAAGLSLIFGLMNVVSLAHGSFFMLGAFFGLSIFKVRSLAVGDGALLLVGSAMFGMFYFASLYVQEVLGYSPLKAGLAFLPVTGGIVVGAGLAQQLVALAKAKDFAEATAQLRIASQMEPENQTFSENLACVERRGEACITIPVSTIKSVTCSVTNLYFSKSAQVWYAR